MKKCSNGKKEIEGGAKIKDKVFFCSGECLEEFEKDERRFRK